MTGTVQVDRTLDCLGLLCPMPIIKITKVIKEIEVGQTLEMLADDPGSVKDMQAWAKQTGHELLDMQQEDDVYRFLVRRTK